MRVEEAIRTEAEEKIEEFVKDFLETNGEALHIETRTQRLYLWQIARVMVRKGWKK